MTQHRTLIDQLGPLLPPGSRTPDTRLREDLRLPDAGVQFFANDIERGFGIALADSAIAGWKTLGDVAATVDGALACVAA